MIEIINNYLYTNYFKSIQSKTLLYLAVISIILTLYTNNNYYYALTQFLVYMYLAYSVNCFVYGNCNFKAWCMIIVPIITCIIIIIDYFPFFKYYKEKLEKIKKLLNRIL